MPFAAERSLFACCISLFTMCRFLLTAAIQPCLSLHVEHDLCATFERQTKQPIGAGATDKVFVVVVFMKDFPLLHVMPKSSYCSYRKCAVLVPHFCFSFRLWWLPILPSLTRTYFVHFNCFVNTSRDEKMNNKTSNEPHKIDGLEKKNKQKKARAYIYTLPIARKCVKSCCSIHIARTDVFRRRAIFTAHTIFLFVALLHFFYYLIPG